MAKPVQFDILLPAVTVIVQAVRRNASSVLYTAFGAHTDLSSSIHTIFPFRKSDRLLPAAYCSSMLPYALLERWERLRPDRI